MADGNLFPNVAWVKSIFSNQPATVAIGERATGSCSGVASFVLRFLTKDAIPHREQSPHGHGRGMIRISRRARLREPTHKLSP